jgi:hypothetical protein
MSYIVTSDVFTPKKKGESITEKELLALGLNIDALVAGGHLKNNPVIKPVEEVK